MKAEIGFVTQDDVPYVATSRMKLVIEPQTRTEWSALHLFAQRMGMALSDCDGTLTFEEPAE